MSESPGRSDVELDAALALLLQRAAQLEAGISAGVTADDRSAGQQHPLAFAADRLKRSVIRPLDQALARLSDPGDGRDEQSTAGSEPDDGDQGSAGPGFDSVGALTGAPLWQLARDATRLRLSATVPAGVHEATAALQDLALRYAPDGESDCAARLTELREIQAELPRGIQSEPNGPYLVTNAENLTDWLGGPLPATPQMALCRCGQSRLKPLCDGTHAEIGFTAKKDPQRVPDRRETYIGQQVTILDNRGTCQHSGFCTDRLATAFRLGREPFVMPSGGRLDEIIRAVRDCPSGALSYGFDGVEARDEVDYHGQREPTIEVSKDGPYRITGAIPLTDGDGKEEARNQGASLEHYALCRCGHSQNKPFCSGMHWYVDFHDPLPDPDRTPTMGRRPARPDPHDPVVL